MDLYEYQGKQLFARFGIPVSDGRVAFTPEEARAFFAAQNPQNRIVQPEEVADAVSWLCGEAAAGVNGASIPISGGDVT